MKRVPAFGSEDEEREFWATHDSNEFVDWSKAKRTHFENLNASSTQRSGRLPMDLFKRLVEAALRPRCRIIQLAVFRDDPKLGIVDEPFDDIGNINPSSWIFMSYELEEISTATLTSATIQLYLDEDGHVAEIVGLDLVEAPFERDFAGAIVDSLAAAVGYYAMDKTP